MKIEILNNALTVTYADYAFGIEEYEVEDRYSGEKIRSRAGVLVAIGDTDVVVLKPIRQPEEFSYDAADGDRERARIAEETVLPYLKALFSRGV